MQDKKMPSNSMYFLYWAKQTNVCERKKQIT